MLRWVRPVRSSPAVPAAPRARQRAGLLLCARAGPPVVRGGAPARRPAAGGWCPAAGGRGSGGVRAAGRLPTGAVVPRGAASPRRPGLWWPAGRGRWDSGFTVTGKSFFSGPSAWSPSSCESGYGGAAGSGAPAAPGLEARAQRGPERPARRGRRGGASRERGPERLRVCCRGSWGASKRRSRTDPAPPRRPRGSRSRL